MITAIGSSLITNMAKALILLAVACAGVVCGKKFRDSKEQKKASESQES